MEDWQRAAWNQTKTKLAFMKEAVMELYLEENNMPVLDLSSHELNPFYRYKGRIIRVVDADTADVYIDLGFNLFTKIRIRIDGFDAPESWRPRNDAEAEHAEAANIRAKELLEGYELTFRTSKDTGIYGRYGASITLPSGERYKDVMINEGFQKKENY